MADAEVRPDFIREDLPTGFGVVEQPLGFRERVFALGWVRKGLLLVAMALVWEGYARWLDNSLLFPTFVETAAAFVGSLRSAELIGATLRSVEMLLKGYAAGWPWRRWRPRSRPRPGSVPTCSTRSPRCSTRCRRSRCCRSPWSGSGSATAASSSC